MHYRIDGFGFAGLIAVCLCGASTGASSIPIEAPLTITQSGDYILSRDIEIDYNVGDSPLIVVASDVDIDFDGHRITGNTSTGDPVVLVYGNNVRLHNGSIRGNREDPPAIRAIDTFGLVVEDMYIDSGGGVELDGAYGFRLEGLFIVHGFNTAVYGWGSQGAVLNCQTMHIGGWGAALYFSGDELLVRGNVFYYAADGVEVSGSGIDIVDNQLIGTWWDGMQLENCSGCNLQRNFVSGPIGFCYKFGGTDSLVEGNECYIGESGGMQVGGSRNTVRNNSMVGGGWGVAYMFFGHDNRHCFNQSRGFPSVLQDYGVGNQTCDALTPVLPTCATAPLGQIAAFQQAPSCDNPATASASALIP